MIINQSSCPRVRNHHPNCRSWHFRFWGRCQRKIIYRLWSRLLFIQQPDREPLTAVAMLRFFPSSRHCSHLCQISFPHLTFSRLLVSSPPASVFPSFVPSVFILPVLLCPLLLHLASLLFPSLYRRSLLPLVPVSRRVTVSPNAPPAVSQSSCEFHEVFVPFLGLLFSCCLPYTLPV